MIFNSITYLLFLACIVCLYWCLPYRPRILLIFSSSLLFYGFWKIEFIPLLLFSTISDYVIAQLICKYSGRTKWYLLVASLVINLGLLFYFKYLIFFSDNAIGFANLLGADLDPILFNIILPLGISFYTFQTISYIVDVYREVIKPEKDFVLFASYVLFFPQLVAGPVLRANEVIPQLRTRPLFEQSHIAIGARRVLFGLFLKVVLADNLAPFVDSGFEIPLNALSAIDVLTLSFLFGFQIYFDFSGYSHIAIGSARMMGIRFPENFNFPYLARSPKEFWKRWHISLSSWIRDYLYLPLSGVKFVSRSTGGLGNQVSEPGSSRPLFLSWAIMGLWHGANWTFILWGLYHAFMIWSYRKLGRFKNTRWFKKAAVLGFVFTLPLMMLSWIPFRADSIKDALLMWLKLFSPMNYTWLGMKENSYLIAFLIMTAFVFVGIYVDKIAPRFQAGSSGSMVRIGLQVADAILVAIMFSLVVIFLRPIQQFIYFQF